QNLGVGHIRAMRVLVCPWSGLGPSLKRAYREHRRPEGRPTSCSQGQQRRGSFGTALYWPINTRLKNLVCCGKDPLCATLRNRLTRPPILNGTPNILRTIHADGLEAE